ncbi:phage head closure protein [Suttonella ornithocola]|uniref:Bacteriophage head-tail adaptor n=1 Tax=Suttonella ornithocola TaxID=279832 RepID=A0A380MSJ2_9GAMM|nr:phage head closure protein [Suttonella ornithocola]SUO95258.1 Bacteriophage head-tail adaptor [Suttonella ornithocola]
METGKLRHRVSIERPIKRQDPLTGVMTDDWAEITTVWAQIAPLSVREFISAAAGQSEITARILMRYRDDIDATCRIVYRGKHYNIHGVLADNKSGVEYLNLSVSEGVNNG